MRQKLNNTLICFVHGIVRVIIKIKITYMFNQIIQSFTLILKDISSSMLNPYVIYSYFRSSTSWRVRIVLNYKGIPHTYKFINLLKGEQKSEEFKKINPNGGVPTLVLPDGTPIIQSMAIIQYLEQVHPENPLLPKDPVKRALIRGFCQVINSGMHPYQNLRLLEKVNQDYGADKMEFAKYWVKRGLDTMEAMVSKSKGKYCFGDEITLADAFFMPQVQGAATRFGVDLTSYPSVLEVMNNLKTVDAFIKAQPKNQPDFQE